jgi:hypothetical protein
MSIKKEAKASRSMLMHMDTFDGTTDVRIWIFNTRWFSSLNDQPLKFLIPAMLRGKALRWFMDKKINPESVDEDKLIEDLILRFGPPSKSKRDYEIEAHNTFLKRSDDPQQYVYNLIDLLFKAFGWTINSDPKTLDDEDDIIRFIVASLPIEMRRTFAITPTTPLQIIEGIVNLRKLEEDSSRRQKKFSKLFLLREGRT